MRIIDFHVHLCRDPAQEQKVFPKLNWPLEWYWASPERVVPYMDARGISELVTHNIMDTARMVETRLANVDDDGATKRRIAKDLEHEMRERVSRFNDWACEIHKVEPRISAFVMADPILFGDELAPEVERSVALGASGVKVHPSICRHLPDDRALGAVFEFCQDRGVPVLTDSNSADEPKGVGYGWPHHWRAVLRNFPRLRLIMAHFCDGMWDERLELAKEFRGNLWFDISGGMVDERHPAGFHRKLMLEQATRVFRSVGIERIMFGSDEPAAGLDVHDYVWQVLRLTLSDDEKERLLWRNAEAFLGSSAQQQ